MGPRHTSDLRELRDHVVVGWDGSAHAERALRWASNQAALEDRRLGVVLTDPDDTESLSRTLSSLEPGVGSTGVTVAVQPGDPRDVLVDVSEHAHLLVVGSRGRGTVRSMLLGSVGAAVSHRASCPVVVSRPPGDLPLRRGIVVGADGAPESRPVLEFAYRQAALRDLPLTVLHSYWDAAAALAQHRQALGEDVQDPELEELRAGLATAVAGLAEQFPDVEVTLSLKHGLTDQALAPKEGAWELVVVGRHPMSGLTRLVTGSVASAVIERSRSSVAVVPVVPSVPA